MVVWLKVWLKKVRLKEVVEGKGVEEEEIELEIEQPAANARRRDRTRTTIGSFSHREDGELLEFAPRRRR